jgi:methionine-rich copper-binding protein CopC
MHEATLTELPKLLTLNFNFTLSPASTITIERDGQTLQTAPGKLSDNKLAMTAELPAGAGMGLYLVKYKACWPDNSCHDGQFAFYVK